MWEEYFPNAQIIGMDINKQCLFSEGRIRCVYGNQGNIDSLLKAVLGYTFDLIIDDGSHLAHHQIDSASVLLPYVAPGGIYVIEDIDFGGSYTSCTAKELASKIDVPSDFNCFIKPTTIGLGKAHCHCGCGGPEKLIVFIRHQK
jgi:hypothetical protein